MPRLAFILFFLILLGGLWGLYRTPPAPVPPDGFHLSQPLQPNEAGRPNLVAIQPWMRTLDYRNASTLEQRLAGYLETARETGHLAPGSIVVFPEHVGTWLVAADAPAASFAADTTTGAMTHLILANPLPFVVALARSDEEDRFAAAVFRMRGGRMARDYQRIFSQLADRYQITIAAGSIVLPEPRVTEGRLRAGNGPLYNVSAVFHPDGRIDPQLVRKVHPIPEEAGFTTAAPVEAIPVFETPRGRLGVLICADSWHPDAYAVLGAANADIIAVPAFLQADSIWDQPWGGYTTGWPDDVDPIEATRHTEGEAWQSFSLGGRLSSTEARLGATAFLRGELWDLGSDGANILVAGDNARVDGQLDSASISVLPLPVSRP